jgi:glutamate N-acetyltransferase/amino-acid N-acetyltransferase
VGTSAAKAIMTTDTVHKEYAVQTDIGGKKITIGGMSKGSGMIHPDMATMLSVITTDAVIGKELLQEILSEDVKDSFNMISVDRDTSTNDTCILLANGTAENAEIKKGSKEALLFAEALSYVTKSLAMQMASDAEGATKLVEVCVIHAKTKADAVLLSKSVITSPLVKTAMYGSDANWGRILCALGYAGVDFDPYQVDLIISSEDNMLVLVKDGTAADYSEAEATQILSEKYVSIVCDMKAGKEKATAWGCDLTYDYVKINGDYRS